MSKIDQTEMTMSLLNNAKRNFKKRKNWLTFDLPYDGKSIMHYKYNSFGKERPRLTTIESKVSIYIYNVYCCFFDPFFFVLDG